VRDTGLTNDTTYYYKVVAVDFAGNRSDESPVFSGTPRQDPMPPIGSVVIDRGATYAETSAVTLGLKVDDADVDQMMVSNNGSFEGAAWQPFAKTLPWTLAPGADGFATVYVKFRDLAGNESNAVTDEIVVRPGLISVSGVVDPDQLPRDGKPDGIWMWVVGHRELGIVRTDKNGEFTFTGLPAGTTYAVAGLGAGYQTPAKVTMDPSVVTTVPVVSR
jgi:hypothetical protein